MRNETIPTQIRAGDDYLLTIEVSDYSSSDYNLSTRLINQKTSLSFTATANANVLGSFDIVIASSDTTDLIKGNYSFIGQAEHKTTLKKTTVIDQLVEVLPNLISATATDLRTTAQKLIEMLDAALINHGAQAYTQSYSIQGREMSFNSHEDFMKFRNQIKAEADRDTRKQLGIKPLTRIIKII
jgi:hypothetical protein